MLTTFLATLLLQLPTQANAHEHRQHHAHEHGTGELNLVLEQNALEIELHSPAIDILGFEHSLKSAKDKNAFAEAKNKVSDTEKWIAFSAAAKCSFDSANIQLKTEDQEHHHNDKNHTEKKEAKHGDGDSEKDDDHAEFHANLKFTCENPAELKQIAFTFEKISGSLKKLKAQVVNSGKQFSQTLSASNNVLHIK